MAFVEMGNSWDLRVYVRKAVNGVIYRIAEQVLAVSQEIKEIVIKTYGLKGSKVLVLKNGIVFDDSLWKSTDLEGEFPLSENKLKIIAVGRLVSLKSYDVLIKAVAEIVSQGFKNISVLVAGDGGEHLRLKELIRDLKLEGYVKLLGMRNDVMRLMKLSDVFVIPSRYEGLSIAMIEAMACGLPVIASNAPGLRDHIIDGRNGLLFHTGSYRALAECILKLARDKKLRNKLSNGAVESFVKEYDMHRNIKSLDMLFRKYYAIS